MFLIIQSFRTMKIKCFFLFRRSTILRLRVQYCHYCLLFDQLDCRYFVRIATSPQNSSIFLNFKSLLKTSQISFKSSIIWIFLLKSQIWLFKTIQSLWFSKCAFARVFLIHQEIFLLLYAYTILTNMLHSFMNSFQGVSSDVIISIFSPIFCWISLIFHFQSVDSQKKSNFNHFNDCVLYC